MNELEMYEKSFKRPSNYFKLSEQARWEIERYHVRTLEEMPSLDNILHGTSHLNDNAGKPVKRSLLFNMLRDLDDISTSSI